MGLAEVIAQRSRCVRSRVGCVIITPRNTVCAAGYNGPPAKWIYADESMCDAWCPRVVTGGSAAYYDDCVASHAEMNCLVRANPGDYEDGTLYVTRVPCYTCAKTI